MITNPETKRTITDVLIILVSLLLTVAGMYFLNVFFENAEDIFVVEYSHNGDYRMN